MGQHAPAIIYVDGEEFIRFGPDDSRDIWLTMFEETIHNVGGEVALMIWKERHGGYLRERMSITASKS